MRDHKEVQEQHAEEMVEMRRHITEPEKSEAEYKPEEKALRDSARRFRSLVETASDWVWEIDRNGFYTYSNSKVKDLLGYEPEQVVGRRPFDFMPPHEAERIAVLFGDIAKFQKPFSGLENVNLHKDGRQIVLETSGVPVFDEEGGFSGYKGIDRDITERKQMEETLRQREQEYRSIFENSVMGIFRIGPDARYLSINPAGAKMHGYGSPEEMIETVTDITHQIYVHPEDRKRLKELVDGNGSVEGFETEHYTKDGGTIWVSVNARAVRDASGTILYYETTSQNITRRKRAEEALKESEEKYRSIFENAVESIFQSTPEGRFISLNPATARMHGYDSPEEMITSITNIGEQLWVNPEERKVFNSLLRNSGIVRNFESRFYRKDGTTIWVSLSALTVKDTAGKIRYYEGIAEDITSRKLAEEELKATTMKLRKTLAGTIHAMALTVETRDPYTAGHQRRVASLARSIAQEMGLSREMTEGIRMAAVIHDIGKISVPAEILSKPTRLSAIEYDLIRVHPRSGYDILKEVDFPWPIARIVLQHHERLDGSGYPQGLKGEQILIEAKILAVADVVEAMASHRPYRPALGPDEALEEIEKNKGILYDTQVVDACIKLFKEKGFKFQ